MWETRRKAKAGTLSTEEYSELYFKEVIRYEKYIDDLNNQITFLEDERHEAEEDLNRAYMLYSFSNMKMKGNTDDIEC